LLIFSNSLQKMNWYDVLTFYRELAVTMIIMLYVWMISGFSRLSRLHLTPISFALINVMYGIFKMGFIYIFY
jgi:hypothetical protein